MHNPMPIPKGGGGQGGKQGEDRDRGLESDFSASSILVGLESNPNSGIQNLCSFEPGTLKPAGSLAHLSSVLLPQTHSPDLSGWIQGGQPPEPKSGFFISSNITALSAASVLALQSQADSLDAGSSAEGMDGVGTGIQPISAPFSSQSFQHRLSGKRGLCPSGLRRGGTEHFYTFNHIWTCFVCPSHR